MADSLFRLARDPIRKLSENERIVGAVRRCYDCGIFPENTILILFFAASYRDENDPSATELSKLFSSGGIGAVLSDVCKIDKDSKLYSKITDLYASFNL